MVVPMSSLYHPRGFWRALWRQPAWHLREWSRNAAYRALHRFDRQLHRLPRKIRAQVEYAGLPIEIVDGPSFLSAWDEIFVNRIYELPVDRDSIPTLVDVGANVGLAALYWKTKYGRFNYVGFEPDPVIAACCRRNLAAWSIKGELIEAAVGAAQGTAMFAADGADGGRLVSGTMAGSGHHPVSIRRLSAHLPAKVDLLKIDVEGAEPEVLAEIEPHLGRVRALFVEWHSLPGSPGLGAAISRLEGAGFDCYAQVVIGPARPFIARPLAGAFAQYLNLYAVRP
jgi:FkbM family methyltransferase